MRVSALGALGRKFYHKYYCLSVEIPIFKFSIFLNSSSKVTINPCFTEVSALKLTIGSSMFSIFVRINVEISFNEISFELK